VIGASLTFPLVSRRRLIGLAFGSMHGARRGSGSDIAGSRAYVSGDDPHRIDWAASGRLSAARGTDEFVVREYFADEAPRVQQGIGRLLLGARGAAAGIARLLGCCVLGCALEQFHRASPGQSILKG
jgi:hypothetical protein